MMMRRFRGTIVGLTPFLFNRYVDAAEVKEAIGARPKDLSKEDAWRQEEGKLRVYKNGQGLFLPGRNIRSACMAGSDAAGIQHKHGRSTRGLGPFLRRGLVVDPTEVLFGVEEAELAAGDTGGCIPGLSLHRDMVRVPPRTGPMVVKYWPKLEQWQLTFEFMVLDDSLQGESELKASLEAAGVFCGLGTGRPDYGKFSVVDWNEVEVEEPV